MKILTLITRGFKIPSLPRCSAASCVTREEASSSPLSKNLVNWSVALPSNRQIRRLSSSSMKPTVVQVGTSSLIYRKPSRRRLGLAIQGPLCLMILPKVYVLRISLVVYFIIIPFAMPLLTEMSLVLRWTLRRPSTRKNSNKIICLITSKPSILTGLTNRSKTRLPI